MQRILFISDELINIQGGPVLLSHDNSVVGLVSCAAESVLGKILSQMFTNVPYYYQWIEHVTGLDIPKCHGRQAPSNNFFED